MPIDNVDAQPENRTPTELAGLVLDINMESGQPGFQHIRRGGALFTVARARQ